MNDWENYLWFSIISVIMTLSLQAIWFISIIPGIDRWNRRFFQSYFSVLILCCLSTLTGIALFFSGAPDAVLNCVLILEFLLLSLPMPMLTIHLLHFCGESIRSSRLLHAVIGLWSVIIVILASSLFIDSFFYTSLDYYRGPLYPLLLLPAIGILLLNFAGTIRRRKQLGGKAFLGFLIALVPMTAAMIVQLFTEATLILDISYTLSALSMYRFILNDQIDQNLRRQREIARQQMEIADQRASIMVLQMRPHFIYNTMTSIYCLCGQDPVKARQVVMDFTTYLRKNFTAIASAEPIPFSSELEHTRAYLAVEQALYEDSIFVHYDMPHTWFRIPPLTLQPIVENAVKHGRDPDAGEFHISIRTRKTDSGNEIVISDNGRGFDPDEESDSGIAINNIRQRLEVMCDGSLNIRPGDGGGTVVTITIPDNAIKEA